LDVGTSEFAGGWGVVKERRKFGWNLGKDVFWGIDGKISEVLFG
jgi:hypothetical protein